MDETGIGAAPPPGCKLTTIGGLLELVLLPPAPTGTILLPWGDSLLGSVL